MSVSPERRLIQARQKNEAAKRATESARQRMTAAIEQAADAGISKTTIASLSGLSRQTIYDILGHD